MPCAARWPAFMLVVLAAATHWGGGVAHAAEGPAPVAVVADFQPLRAQFTLQRPGRAEPVHLHLGTSVYPGDRLVLARPGQSVTLQMADGRELRFDRPGEHRVPEARSLGRLATILGSIPDLFGDASGLGGTAVSRDIDRCGMPGFQPEPPRLPAAPEAGARLAPGALALPVAWTGGCAPFVVELRRDGQILFAQSGLAQRSTRIVGTRLEAGRYQLVIAGVDGQSSALQVEVPQQALPVPAELRDATSDLGKLAEAVWFTQQEEGGWVLEAVRRLDPLVQRGDPLATHLQQGWLTGQPLR